ncbi:MAG: FAD-dependent oxidoreductase [Gammaproteobacteria bacterium]|nr:FAD-dependent oxidoreductase [Gammaproteobacteria bacterium]
MTRRLLFEPARLGPLALRNRIVFPPMTTGYESQGVITPRSRAFYRRIARGGAAMIVIGDVSIQPSFAPTPYAYDDSFVPGLRQLVDDVHAEGALVAAQLFHQEYDTGEVARLMRTEGREAAMKRLHADFNDYCNRLTHEDIAAVRERFRRAAIRVRDAGFDLIQLHGDRLLGMFCSPRLNRRTDEYGGSLENRARFVLEIVRTIREAVPELPIEYKLAVIRTDPPMGKAGPTLPEAQRMVPWLEAAGVAGFHVALANHDGLGDTIPAMGTQPYGCFLDLAEGVKQVARVPVTAVGRILDPDFAEDVLASGRADLIGVGRGLIAEPDWPRLVERGDLEEIHACIMCNHCASSLMSRKPLECAVNATVGTEDPVVIERAAHRRRVVVLGGGPAGMEAARVAALRGHDVTLVERAPTLGGQLPLCAAPPYKKEIDRLARYLAQQISRRGVCVKLGSDAPIGVLLDELRPDAVVVATGSHPAIPALPGFDAANVVTAWDALTGEAPVGKRAIVVGGGAVGVETALTLAPRGIAVTIVEMLEQIAGGESPTIVPFIESQLRRFDVRVLTRRRVVAWESGRLRIADPDGNESALVADTVLVATGTRRNEAHADEIERRGIEYRVAGDCSQGGTGTLAGAIHDGFRAAMSID